MAQALVPLKDLVEAKTRLAGLLRPSERRALAQAMAEDVLGVLDAHPEITQITLVTDDPGGALLAQNYGARCWSERSLQCRGLNAVVASASARLLEECDEPLVVLHADLPLLSVADISKVLQIHRNTQSLVIGADREGRGTNLLVFDAKSVPRFCFGLDSCTAHSEVAREAGSCAEVVQTGGIELDVDDAQDLKLVLAMLGDTESSNTARLLRDGVLGRRVAMALASIPDERGDDAGREVVS